MKKHLMAFLLVALIALPVPAHFIWIVPNGPADEKASVIFSEDLEPDEAVAIEKIAGTRLQARDRAGKVTALTWTKGEHAYIVRVPNKNTAVVGGVCRYGVIQRGKGKPFLLAYYPKLIRGRPEASKAWNDVPLEFIPQGDSKFQVLFAGKPAANAEVVVLAPAAKDKEKLTTDARGTFKIRSHAAGLYGIRARYLEAKTGEEAGKKYEEIRHYATLVFRIEAGNR